MSKNTLSSGVSRMRRAVRAAVICLCAGGAALSPVASGDEYLSQANRGYLAIATDKRSDLVMLPLVAKMDATPGAVGELGSAAMLPADVGAFAEARAWAEKPAQRAVLEGLDKVTKATKWKEAFAWGLPYGVENVPVELVEARMYSELGDPPTLAAARHFWLPEMERVACLVNVEATRLAADGKPTEGVEVLLKWAHLCRQLMDRQMMTESRWGGAHMLQALERVRDVAYEDIRGKRLMDPAKLPDQISKFGGESMFDLGRMQMPRGDWLAASQVAARVFDASGAVNTGNFGPTLAKLGATEYPLRLFAESARWRSAAGSHADGKDTLSKIKSVQDDFASRWNLGWFDKRHSALTEYERLRSARFALISRAMPDMRELFDQRQLLIVEMQGTQLSLALSGYVITNKDFPPQLTAIRPRWVVGIGADPFSRDVVSNQRSIPEYMIPMKRRLGMPEKEEPKPHEMDIVPATGSPFATKLTNTTFILYSVGADSVNHFAKRVQNTTKVAAGSDYLIWPPVISLHRQHLRDSQQLK